jgi:hypothetical protein
VTCTAFCKIWGFHGSDYEECQLQGCDAMWLLLIVTAYVILSSLIPSTLMMEAILYSKMSVLTWHSTQKMTFFYCILSTNFV